MTKGDLDITVLGRPLKPLALGFSIYMLALFYALSIDGAPLSDLFVGDMLGWAGFLTFIMFNVAWWGNKQYWLEIGLLMVVFIMATQTVMTLFFADSLYSVLFSFSVALISAGAYLLETADRRRWY